MLTRVATLFVALCLSGLTCLAWWLPNRPSAPGTELPDQKFNAVSFAPFRPGQSPLTHSFPTAAQVEADLALIAPRVRAVRTYAATEGSYDMAALAARHGLKLWLGIWLGPDRARNRRELAGGIALARAWPDTVERVIVGNEVLLRRDLPLGELAANLDQVRAAVPQRVTYADVWEFWDKNPSLAAHVDEVTVHLLPYWEDAPTGIDGAVAQVRAVYRQMHQRFPGKPIVIGETGWPSAGRWRRDAAPSRVNQAIFLRRFVAAAIAEGFDYNLIEAFDQVWKATNEGTVGARWGLWTADRVEKFPFLGAVVEDPSWRWRAAAAIGLGLLLALIPLPIRLPIPPGISATLPALSFKAAWRTAWQTLGLPLLCSNALVFAWSGTVPVAFSLALQAAAMVNMTGQTMLAVLLITAARRRLAGLPPPLPPTAAQATAHLRRLILACRLPPRTAWLDDLACAFTWTAAVLQVLLVIDPRYRDFPLPVFAVPLVAVGARAWLGDLPRGGGGREEAVLGGILILGAIASLVQEGPLNRQSLIWNAAAAVLAGPSCLRLLAAASPTPRAMPQARPR